MNIPKLAVLLANRCADWHEAKAGKASQIAKARFEGACEVVHLDDFGRTPNEVFLDIMEWYRDANERPAAGQAFPTARKAWTEKAEREISDVLDEIAGAR